ncbi:MULTISPECIES: outer membrane protein assembly factor BamC [unclassified Alcanivorax]|jgi:outer membrane protein assembly factor BamC|uniref:outer membrane protein assembly factor BamC n=1 Tax=unclassified Alcanivorax TaxID=2638842 RepID=UPI000789CC90|nr:MULTISPECIES: outer membrane protein assembly factor BamC [unclassified Alcanivorax]MEE2603626.1 outer membrane protein assembly factor BamC [Pseudomonadota bacterium]SEF43444.1 outer membrane protein assembly factor BamC [Alcanivorax sp. DSM 26293]|tara:strand:+ start:126 stop:740 length:615 start_codon:yes stop_codon:yes gene_type:complete
MKKAALTLALLVSATSGCSWLPDSSLNYRDAQVLEPMEVPEDGVFIGEQPLYSVPRQEERLVGRGEDEKRFAVPRPPQLVVLGSADDDEAQQPAPKDASSKAILARDGNGYPIIMMSTRFAWAWEYVGEALGKTDLKISDRDREVGIYYLRVPERYTLGAKSAQLKLSHTTNGIQVAVLNEEGTALVEKTPGQAILERIFDELN